MFEIFFFEGFPKANLKTKHLFWDSNEMPGLESSVYNHNNQYQNCYYPVPKYLENPHTQEKHLNLKCWTQTSWSL